MNKNIVICIPAYNPTEDLISIVNELIDDFMIVIINDGSKSNAIFKKLNKNVILLSHDINKGKGQALKTGFSYILNNIKCDGVITVDADGQHLPKDIKIIAKNIKKNDNSIVLGTREISKMPFKSRFGNSLTSFVFKLATSKKVTDTQTGLRGIPFHLLEKMIEINGDRYEYEINMLIYCTKNSISFTEIPINTVYKNNNESSNFNPLTDSFKIYKCLTANSNLKATFFYCISSILAFIIDFSLLFIFKNIFSYIENTDLQLLVCVILARLASSMFNFIFNKLIVFQKKHTYFLKEFLQYYALVILVLILDYLLLDVLAVKLTLNLVISKIIVETLLFIGNYIIQKYYIFKKRTNGTN